MCQINALASVIQEKDPNRETSLSAVDMVVFFILSFSYLLCCQWFLTD